MSLPPAARYREWALAETLNRRGRCRCSLSSSLPSSVLLSDSFEHKEAPLHSFFCPVWHYSPRRSDINTIPFYPEETCLLSADPFGIPCDIDLGNPFIPFNAIDARVCGHAV